MAKRHFAATAFAVVLAGCAMGQTVISDASELSAQEEEMRRTFLAGGYIPSEDMPDSLKINPPPPAEGSAAHARDVEASEAGLALQDTPRFKLAAIDAAVIAADGSNVFSCASGFVISPQATPKLDGFLKKTTRDLALSTYRSKNHYKRPRPFMVNEKPTCTPDHETMLRKDGSYPSGHSAIGYGWGLILAEVVPGKAAELVARGREFGESRRICNVHWKSDVEEGRHVAAAIVARLHASAEFNADLAAARAEVVALPADRPVPDCALEREALGGA